MYLTPTPNQFSYMFYIYLIQSKKDKELYIGFTQSYEVKPRKIVLFQS